jgi:hypothetical protein
MSGIDRATARRMMRPGVWVPALRGYHDAEVEAWIAAAPEPFGGMLRVLVSQEAMAYQAESVRHVGHLWRNVIRQVPELSAWADAHLLEWLDTAPVMLPHRRGRKAKA